MKSKVLVTTSGVGARLGEVTNYTNKSLIRVGEKPSISHIVESYPNDTDFVVTLGYFGDHVRDFLEIAYPNRKFEFVYVDNFSGEGSSLLYSLLKAKDLLQSPFIFHASDTITMDEIPEPSRNWIAGYKGRDSTSYASLTTYGSIVKEIHQKGHMDYDLIHVGLIGIFDFKQFWSIAENVLEADHLNSSLGDVDVLKKQISLCNFEAIELETWHDIGSVDSLLKARECIANDKFNVLDKLAESIYLVDGHFVKFFSDPQVLKDRVQRTNFLNNVTPPIVSSRKNFYKYKSVDAELFSRVSNRYTFLDLIKWAEKELWRDVPGYDIRQFEMNCKDFYYNKTLSRVDELHKKKNIEDVQNIINGEPIPSLKELLEGVDFQALSSSRPTNFHGDFILDNILVRNDREFKLIDWRQDFSGDLEAGDRYYDLAKLAHNLVVNHDIVEKGLFGIEVDTDGSIKVEIFRKQTLVDSERVYFNYLEENSYDVKKVKFLRAIIWLNMAPLHHHPFDLFLYYYGKYELAKLVDLRSDEGRYY